MVVTSRRNASFRVGVVVVGVHQEMAAVVHCGIVLEEEEGVEDRRMAVAGPVVVGEGRVEIVGVVVVEVLLLVQTAVVVHRIQVEVLLENSAVVPVAAQTLVAPKFVFPSVHGCSTRFLWLHLVLPSIPPEVEASLHCLVWRLASSPAAPTPNPWDPTSNCPSAFGSEA